MVKKESVTEITQTEFPKIISDKKTPLVIVDFFAEWCMPCVMMGPVFKSLAEKYTQVKFCKINIDDAPNLSNEYEISSIPCIVFFKDGEEVDRVVGSVSEEIFEEKVSDYLNL
jgi:thioredoxin 1